MIKASDWERVNDAWSIVSDANNIQHLFSSVSHPVLWRAIPAFEALQTAWEEKRAMNKYRMYADAIECGLEKLRKYYHKFDEKDVYILALGTSICMPPYMFY